MNACSIFAEPSSRFTAFCWRTMMKGKKKETPEERAEREARWDRTTRMLQERIAYHEAKLEEERAAKEAS
jgi:hypothetical protein